SGRTSPEWLAPIVNAASSSRVPLYENATSLLSELTEHFPAACDAVANMAQATRSRVRFNAILCLGRSTPPSLTLQILRQCLRDKSARVRLKAADWAGRLRLRKIVPDLEEAAARERNANARRTIEFELKLLRDGYILEPGSDEGLMITTF